MERLTKEHGTYSTRIYGYAATRRSVSSKFWRVPPLGVVKINVDACLPEEGSVGLGVVARNASGRVLFSATRHMRAWWPVEIAMGRH